MRFCALKNVSTAQPPVGQLATGVPRSSVLKEDALLEMDVGILLRLKNHTLSTFECLSVSIDTRRAGIADLRDTRLGKFSDEHSPLVCSELGAVGGGIGVHNRAPRIGVILVRTVGRVDNRGGLQRRDLVAPRLGVQRHLVVELHVPVLEGVDFSKEEQGGLVWRKMVRRARRTLPWASPGLETRMRAIQSTVGTG